MPTDITVRFWGVRGSIAGPGPHSVRYGGNTSCVELRCGDHLLILDAGTGLRELGDNLVVAGGPVDVDLLCSHTHLDHICGFPFFAPCYSADNRIRVWAARAAVKDNIGAVFRMILTPPLSPIMMTSLKAAIEFKYFVRGEAFFLRPGLLVKTGGLNHPGGASGYRIEWRGKSVAYITDTEHRAGELDSNVLALVDHADIAIYDANYTDEDYPSHAGWGHSTWQEAVKIARQASIKTLVLFHHDPARTDAMLDAIAAEASRAYAGTLVARESLVLSL
ncbi:MAG: MBL fold metallo-hydrolase [Alphaproteobacteria bacterium]|nr:MBL fold metallo-hydrolase [Alphaproteobacteria bacterium]